MHASCDKCAGFLLFGLLGDSHLFFVVAEVEQIILADELHQVPVRLQNIFFCMCRGIVYALGSSSVISIIKVSWSAHNAAGSVRIEDAGMLSLDDNVPFCPR